MLSVPRRTLQICNAGVEQTPPCTVLRLDSACSSPEFELALYTLCFVAGSEQSRVHMGGYDVLIK